MNRGSPDRLPTVTLWILENYNFCDHKRYPNFALLAQLWPQFTPWRWSKSTKVNIFEKNLIHRAIQIPSIFNEKCNYFLLYLDFFGYKLVQDQRSRGHSLGQHHFFKMPSIRAKLWWKDTSCSSFQTQVIPALVSFFTFSDPLFWL